MNSIDKRTWSFGYLIAFILAFSLIVTGLGQVAIAAAPDEPSAPSPADGATNVSTSPTLEVTVSDPDGDSMDVTFYDASDDSAIGTDSGVSDGGTASVTWSGLSYGTSYSWYAVADDGTDTTQSDTWSFDTNYEPTADAGGPYEIDEGDSLSLDGSGSSDSDGSIDFYSWDLTDDGTYGDASGESPNLDWSTLKGLGLVDGVESYPISLKVEDNDGATDTANTDLTIDNVPPSITLSGNSSVDEGSQYTLNISSVTDPGDDTVDSCTVDWGDGTSDDCLSSLDGSMTHTYADGLSNPTISIDLEDEDGSYSDVYSLSVTVNNVDPTIDNVSITPSPSDEGEEVTFEATASDPGDDPLTYNWTIDGTDYNDQNPVNVTFNDDKIIDWSLEVTDGDGGSATNSGTHTVKNVKPTVNLTGGSAVNEGSSYTLTLDSVDDPGDDSWTQITVHWGDGHSDTYTSLGAKEHIYADNGDYDITVDVTDEDGTFSDRGSPSPVTATVNNVAPTIDSVTSNQTVDEGAELSITDVVTFSDPAFEDSATENTKSFTYDIDWDDGHSDDGDATIDTRGSRGTETEGSFDASHTYADNGNYTVEVTITDDNGGTSGTGTFEVDVENVDPTLTLSNSSDRDIVESSSISVDADFDDPAYYDSVLDNTKYFDYEIDWGYGSEKTSGQLGHSDVVNGDKDNKTEGSFSHSHTYNYGISFTDSNNLGWYKSNPTIDVDDLGGHTPTIHYKVNGGPKKTDDTGDVVVSVPEGNSNTVTYWATVTVTVDVEVEDDDGGEATDSFDVKITKPKQTAQVQMDKTAPTIVPEVPTEGQNFILNEVVTTDVGASDNLSGVNEVTVADVLNTSSAGQHELAVTATDSAGNEASTDITYNVTFRPKELSPYLKWVAPGAAIDYDDLELNTVKQGESFSFAFALRDSEGDPIEDAPVSFTLAELNVSDGEYDVGKGLELGSFQYDEETKVYSYKLDTSQLETGKYIVWVGLRDGTRIVEKFELEE